jgi:hypothetical protein
MPEAEYKRHTGGTTRDWSLLSREEQAANPRYRVDSQGHAGLRAGWSLTSVRTPS